MSTKPADKVKILNAISDFYSFKRKADFAEFLGVPPTTLSSWYARNTFDIDVISDKCQEIDLNELFRHGIARPVGPEGTTSNQAGETMGYWERIIERKDARNLELAEQIGALKEQIRQLKAKK